VIITLAFSSKVQSSVTKDDPSMVTPTDRAAIRSAPAVQRSGVRLAVQAGAAGSHGRD
jgi:hypothetical protein